MAMAQPLPDRDANAQSPRTTADLRQWVRENDRGASVLVQFHHACCDGVGAMQFIEDLLTAYAAANSESGQSPAMRPISASAMPG